MTVEQAQAEFRAGLPILYCSGVITSHLLAQCHCFVAHPAEVLRDRYLVTLYTELNQSTWWFIESEMGLRIKGHLALDLFWLRAAVAVEEVLGGQAL